MTNPQEPDTAGLRALAGVLAGLRAIAEGRLAGLAIAEDEYLADIYCIQRVANLLAMELSALGRTLRRAEAQAGAAEVQAIADILVRAFSVARLPLDQAVLDLATSTVRRKGDMP